MLVGDIMYSAQKGGETPNILGINNRSNHAAAAAAAAYATTTSGVLPSAIVQAVVDLLAKVLEEQRSNTAVMGQVLLRIEQLNTTLVASQVWHTHAWLATCIVDGDVIMSPVTDALKQYLMCFISMLHLTGTCHATLALRLHSSFFL